MKQHGLDLFRVRLASAQGQNLMGQPLSIIAFSVLLELDAQNRLRCPIASEANQSGPANLRMLIEHRFARNRKQGSGGSYDALRLSATKPKPAVVVEITQVAHAVENAVRLRIMDFC